MKPLKLLPFLLMGLFFASCQPKDTIGILYVLNLSEADTISLVSAENDTLNVPRGKSYFDGCVYLAHIYGTWSKDSHAYSVRNSAVSSLNIKSVIIDGTGYTLTDSLSASFRKVGLYKKLVEEREELIYVMDDPFIELVKSTCR